MGTEYYAVNKRDKTFYELGKGSWYILNQDKEAFTDLDYLALYIWEDIYDEGSFLDKENIASVKDCIYSRVAPDLFKLCNGASPKDMEVFNDCGDELTIIRSLKYKCIGSRFGDIDSEQYIKDLEYINRHLRDDPFMRRLYDPESLKNYPDFERFK
jgi:hypothetical protein